MCDSLLQEIDDVGGILVAVHFHQACALSTVIDYAFLKRYIILFVLILFSYLLITNCYCPSFNSSLNACSRFFNLQNKYVN